MTENLQPQSKTFAPADLPCWREVAPPHADIAQGLCKNEDFAPDLGHAAAGQGSPMYLDPVEFFNRTYITAGMKNLLSRALAQLAHGRGSVMLIKSSFGGGKTHNMLALYHLAGGKVDIDKIPVIKPVLQAANINSLPKAHIVVIAGTNLDPANSKTFKGLPGARVNTFWGEIAARLALSANKPELYDYVRKSDVKGCSPGSETFKNLFDACGTCLVLIDELVAYARKLYGVKNLPAGTFDNFITFIQEITEGACKSANTVIVASVPDSPTELGEAGKFVFNAVIKHYGRKETICEPVSTLEYFEIARKRLFTPYDNKETAEQVCNNFSQMYRQNDFPQEAREEDYKQKLLGCYPVHPELFSRLFEDWAALENFQGIRSVLRFLAVVVHKLWNGNDAGLLILPGSLPLNIPAVRDELINYLPPEWKNIIDCEVDGENSLAFQEDNIRFGKQSVCRRVARTILLGSLAAKQKGIEKSRIFLAVAQPGEQLSLWEHALITLKNKSICLYSRADRFWFDTKPTLRKIANDRIIPKEAIELEIKRRLTKLRPQKPFANIHIPSSPNDVPDLQKARLVILPPQAAYSGNEDFIHQIMTDGRRKYKNMLLFLAPDSAALENLELETRNYLAWRSIKEDKFDLDKEQRRELAENIRRGDQTVNLLLRETWRWLFVPYTDRATIANVNYERIRLSGDGIVESAAARAMREDLIITKLSPDLLLLELNELLWKDSGGISIKKLWDALCSYCYFPRLADYRALEDAIKTGLAKGEYFAYAAGKKEEQYIDLQKGQSSIEIDLNGYLIKLDTAQQPGIQIKLDSEDKKTSPVRFFLSTHLDQENIGAIMREIVNNLTAENDVKIRIEIEANLPEGIKPQTKAAILENCGTLKIEKYGFEDQ